MRHHLKKEKTTTDSSGLACSPVSSRGKLGVLESCTCEDLQVLQLEAAAVAPGQGGLQVCPGAAPCPGLLWEQPGPRLHLAITLHMANCVISLEDLCLVIGLS